jgi:hypothetical protein
MEILHYPAISAPAFILFLDHQAVLRCLDGYSALSLVLGQLQRLGC